mgnify:CR=1 FL=1|tara:strand:+ start:208 stop:495 length:288 start_codon:yes stop_codon:yes gene_type:complete
MQFQLFLGRNIRNAGKISKAMMSEFIHQEVATRFDAFTITEGIGFWKGEQENVTILTFITEEAHKVSEIADAFKVAFRQETVLMTEMPLPVCQFV